LIPPIFSSIEATFLTLVVYYDTELLRDLSRLVEAYRLEEARPIFALTLLSLLIFLFVWIPQRSELALVTNLLRRVITPLIAPGLTLLIILFLYAFIGRLMFDKHGTKYFGDVPTALDTVFLMSLGEGPDVPDLIEFSGAMRVHTMKSSAGKFDLNSWFLDLTPRIFYWSFHAIITMCLVNLFVAIVVGVYTDSSQDREMAKKYDSVDILVGKVLYRWRESSSHSWTQLILFIETIKHFIFGSKDKDESTMKDDSRRRSSSASEFEMYIMEGEEKYSTRQTSSSSSDPQPLNSITNNNSRPRLNSIEEEDLSDLENEEDMEVEEKEDDLKMVSIDELCDVGTRVHSRSKADKRKRGSYVGRFVQEKARINTSSSYPFSVSRQYQYSILMEKLYDLEKEMEEESKRGSTTKRRRSSLLTNKSPFENTQTDQEVEESATFILRSQGIEGLMGESMREMMHNPSNKPSPPPSNGELRHQSKKPTIQEKFLVNEIERLVALEIKDRFHLPTFKQALKVVTIGRDIRTYIYFRDSFSSSSSQNQQAIKSNNTPPPIN